ncbi:MAG: ECF transporter S component [Clostridia bacterium]|nr:ECF transporter S component [Clostridia bacterium]
MKTQTRKLTAAGAALALCFVLPFLTLNNPQLGNMLCLMHIPVMLCGFICGWKYGFMVGLLAPILRSAILGAPPMMPTAVCMTFELGVYGLCTGLFSSLLPKKLIFDYITLIIAMLLGRVAWGVATALIVGGLTFEAYLASAFVAAVWGIVIQLVIVVPLVLAVRRTKLI